MEEKGDMEEKSPDSSQPASLSSQHDAHHGLNSPSSVTADDKQKLGHQMEQKEKTEVTNVTDVSNGPPLSHLPLKDEKPEPHVKRIVAEPSRVQDLPSPSSLTPSTSQANETLQSKGNVHIGDAGVSNVPLGAYSEVRSSKGGLRSVDHSGDLTYYQMGVPAVPKIHYTYPSTQLKQVERKNVGLNRGLVDTAAPFESVKEAVSKFGGIVDWKAHKTQLVEKRKQVESELEKSEQELSNYKKNSAGAEMTKAQVLKELDTTKRLIEELKLNVEKAQTEEYQARQDSELVKLRVEEMERGIGVEASVAAKAQLEVAKARHTSATAELKMVKDELEKLRTEYSSLVVEKDLAMKKSEEVVSASKKVEKRVDELTVELISVKESLESVHAAHLEAEEQRIGAAMAREQDYLNWQKDIKQAEEELHRLNQELMLTNELKEKLDASSSSLVNLKSRLSAYKEAKLNNESASLESELEPENETQPTAASLKKELEEVRLQIEKTTAEVNSLKAMATSLKSEIEKEKTARANMAQREGMASVVVAALEAELNRNMTEIANVQMKEKESKEKMVELPKQVQQAAQEADEAKSLAQQANEELSKAKEEVELVKASANTVESRLHAAQKEIEVSKVSERLALSIVKAMHESESASSTDEADASTEITLPAEEYYMLRKRTMEAEEQSNTKVAAVLSQIEVAKESELGSLRKLEEVNKEKAAMKEALRIATEKAEKAKEGKLAVEQKLRIWRSEHEQQRRNAKSGDVGRSLKPSYRRSFEEPKSFDIGRDITIPVRPKLNPLPEVIVKKKKKRLFPRLVMFFAGNKTQRLKSI